MKLVQTLKSRWLTEMLEYGLMFLVLFYSSMWALFTSAGVNTALRLAIPLLAVLIALRLLNQPIPRHRVKRLVVLGVFLAVYLIATRYNPIRYVLYYFTPLALLTVYLGLADDRGNGMGLLYKLSNIVTVIAAVSLFCFLFGTLLGWLPKVSVTYEWGGRTQLCGSYFYLHFESQLTTFMGQDLLRNCGPFPEAPGFAIFLTVATGVETLLRDRLRPVPCVLLVAAALTTFSTKAILLVALAFVLRYSVRTDRTPMGRKVKRIAVPVIAVAAMGAGLVLLADKLSTESGRIRIDDLLACVKTWLTAPLFGTGYWNDDAVIPFFSYAGRSNNGLSMGLAVVLAQGGLYLLTLYVVPAVLCVLRFTGEMRRRTAAFFVLYAGLLFTTNMPYTFLALFVLAMSLELQRHHSDRNTVIP